MHTAQPHVIAFVEWHDAEIGSVFIPVSSADPSEIRFDHISIYHRRDTDVFEIWSHRATLHIFGLETIAIVGGYGTADYVSEARLFSCNVAFGDTDFLPDVTLPIDKIDVRFGSGRTVTITCRNVQLVLSEPVEHVEDWVGPLR